MGAAPEGAGDGAAQRVVWRFVDGKAGHDSQSLGLVRALERLRPVAVRDLAPPPVWRCLGVWFGGRVPDWAGLPAPDLVVGAGHATHWPVLAARRAAGGRAVVLMRPSLPVRWFDLCLAPEHDRVPERANVLRTLGPLNAIPPGAGGRSADRGLILVGGPSDHYGWDGEALVWAVRRLAEARSRIRWTLTTSRRTPEGFAEALSGIGAANLTVVPCGETGPGWVAEQLGECSRVWVTEDSVSMLHEAVTSGARVGVLPMPGRANGGGRVASAVAALHRSGRVTLLAEVGPGWELPPPPPPLAEADRCAEEVVRRFGW